MQTININYNTIYTITLFLFNELNQLLLYYMLMILTMVSVNNNKNDDAKDRMVCLSVSYNDVNM